jgi:hypothetical protein
MCFNAKTHMERAPAEFEQEKRVYLLGHNVSQPNSTNINSKKKFFFVFFSVR